MIDDIHHVGIAVSDLDEALALYRDALALPLVKLGDAPARGARVAVLGAGNGYLELVQPTNDESPFARHIAERGQGLHHLAVRSDDVEADVARLREMGAALEDETPRDGFTGRLSYLRAEAFDGAVLEVVQPSEEMASDTPLGGHITRIDHVVLRVPDSAAVAVRLEEWFGFATKRTFERGGTRFCFARPRDAVIEVIGPIENGEPESGRIAGLAFEVKGIDDLAATLKAAGYPIGEPHPALQGGRIVSVHHTGACGVPLAFIDFTGSPGPPARE